MLATIKILFNIIISLLLLYFGQLKTFTVISKAKTAEPENRQGRVCLVKLRLGTVASRLLYTA